MNVELLIPVCIFHTLDQYLDHLAKLQKINGAAMFTASVQLLCLQMNGCVKRQMDDVIERKRFSIMYFKNWLSLSLDLVYFCVRLCK